MKKKDDYQNKKALRYPTLRFPGFSGEWEVKEFLELVNKSSAKYNPEVEEKNYECIELESLSQETGIIINTFNSKEQKSTKNKFKKGDILFGKLRPYLKKFLKVNFDGVCSSEIWVFNGAKVSNDFLYFLIQTYKFNYIANISSGSKMPRADWDYVSSTPFFYPSKEEQTKIADFLTEIDNKINQLDKKKHLLEHYKKGVMQQIFNQTIRFTDDDGQEFPEWEEKKLKENCQFFSGGTPLTTNKKFYDNGQIPFIKSGEINLNSTTQFITDLGLKNSSAKMVNVGDLLYALYGATSGELAISKIKGAINQAILCIRTTENTSFIYFYLFFQKKNILNTYLQGGQGNLSADIIKSLVIPLPHIKEQTKIADFLTEIDNKIALVEKQLNATQQYKKGLLQQMFV